MAQRKTYLEYPSALEEAQRTYTHISNNLYNTKLFPRLNKAKEDYLVCDCRYNLGDPIDDACGSECINRILFVECNNDCPCGIHCTNNRFQKGTHASVDVFKSGGKGYGLRTMEPISKDSFIIEYTGEIIPSDNFEKRQSDYTAEGIQHFYFMSLNTGQLIDATKKGCVARFINHSCRPNCYVQKWIVNRRNRIGIYALRDIEIGEELTFNYNTDRHGMAAQRCLCGEDNCCGYLGGPKASEDSDDEEDTSAPLPLIDPDEVPDFMRLMLGTVQSRDDVYQILCRLEVTNNEEVLRAFKKLHGLLVLKAYLTEWKSDNELALKTLEILPKIPILARNTIEDSNIEEKIEVFRDRMPRMTELVDQLKEQWSKLVKLYRIPKKSKEQIERERREEEERQKRQEEERQHEKEEKEKREKEESEEAARLASLARRDSYRGAGNSNYKRSQNYRPYGSNPRRDDRHHDHKASNYREDPHNMTSHSVSTRRDSEVVEQRPRYESSRDFYDSYRPATSDKYRPSTTRNDWPGTTRIHTKESREGVIATTPQEEKRSAAVATPSTPPPPTVSLPDLTSLPQVPKVVEPGRLAPNWCEVVGDEGQIYYYNIVTHKTQWERPVVDDKTTLEGYSVAAIDAVIERAMAAQQNTAVELERAPAVAAVAVVEMNEAQFKEELAKLVVDRCSRWKGEFTVVDFKKHARAIRHLVEEKELRREKDTLSLTDSLRARVKKFVAEYIGKLLARRGERRDEVPSGSSRKRGHSDRSDDQSRKVAKHE